MQHMKRTRVSFTVILFLWPVISIMADTKISIVPAGKSYPTENAYLLEPGEQLSGQQFQTNAILTYKNYQYTVYYNDSRNVCIARRKLPSGIWEEVVLPYRNSQDDAHNVIAMGICRNDGSIHLAYDHHNDPLHYCYSIKGSANDPLNMPWSADSFSSTTDIMDAAVRDVTYPRFISKPDGNLLFECRFHYSGYGDSYLREYDAETKRWTLLGRYIQGMDVNENNPVKVNNKVIHNEDACAYINGITYDSKGDLHVTWMWRDDFGGQSNHDFYYAYSSDDGRSWKNTYGEQIAATQYMLPVVNRISGGCLSQHLRDKLMIEEIAKNRGLINQETQAVDSKGYIHAINSHIPDGMGTDTDWISSRRKACLHHRYRQEDGSWVKRIVTWNGQPVYSPYRVHLAFDSFDNAYIIANGAGIYAASPEDNYENWILLSEDGKTGYCSEPLADRELLKEKGILSFVYLSPDKKVVVSDYLAKNPNTPQGKGLKAEYFSDKHFTELISWEIVARPDQSIIPSGTKSIRWSGAFETLLGEEYSLYIHTAGETGVYINDSLIKVVPKNHFETELNYNVIASHKNTIVIESKTSIPVTLFWSSNNTIKEKIPAASFSSEIKESYK